MIWDDLLIVLNFIFILKFILFLYFILGIIGMGLNFRIFFFLII